MFRDLKNEIADAEANRSVIQDFENYMIKQKMDNTSTTSKSSTIVKALGHLFEYHDSLLHFETEKDPNFNLQRLLNPLNDDFLEIADPTAIDGWDSKRDWTQWGKVAKSLQGKVERPCSI